MSITNSQRICKFPCLACWMLIGAKLKNRQNGVALKEWEKSFNLAITFARASFNLSDKWTLILDRKGILVDDIDESDTQEAERLS